MKRTPIALSAALLAAALPFAASAAEGVSYNYVEAGYTAINADGAPDADGYAANASFAVHPNFHIFGGYANREFDNTNFDFDQYRVGVGYNYELSPKLDLVTRVAYEAYDFGRDFAGNRIDPDGYSAEAGVRSPLTNNLEGYAMLGYQDYGRTFGDDVYGRVGAQVKFNQNWGINGDVKVIKGGDTEWFVGPRFTW